VGSWSPPCSERGRRASRARASRMGLLAQNARFGAALQGPNAGRAAGPRIRARSCARPRAVRLVGAAFLPLRRPPVVVGWPRDYNRSRREQVRPMERRISMPLGVVVERREIDNRWQPFAWKAVAVIPGAPPV